MNSSEDSNTFNCKRVRVSGYSMEPLILDGDCILIDCSKTEKIEPTAGLFKFV